jgi:pSer/pThr/pTyr-binding forkhead associated (FHA) protein
VVSTEHAVIEQVDNPDARAQIEYYIHDLASTNGTQVNGDAVNRRKLSHNDVIRIGWVNFKFIDENKADPDETARIHKSWIPGVYYTKK